MGARAARGRGQVTSRSHLVIIVDLSSRSTSCRCRPIIVAPRSPSLNLLLGKGPLRLCAYAEPQVKCL